MYIISKVHDYYDTAIGVSGVDKSVIYERHNRELTNSYHSCFGIFYSRSMSGWANYPQTNYTPFIVGFCGKTYVGYEKFVDYGFREYEYGTKCFRGNETTYYYGKNAINEIISFSKNAKSKWIKNALEQSFAKYHNKENFTDLFVDEHTPVFLIRPNKVIDINPMLKDIKFAKMFEPFQAFQEIEMYMGGVLTNPERNMIIVGEEYRQKQHGMDKWSFRNPDPPKRKQKHIK